MPKTISLSASKLRQFMSCRRRYWFEYVEGLRPRVRETPLSFGNAVHAGLEHLSRSRKFTDDIIESITESYSALEIEQAGLAPKVALEAVRAYAEHHPEWKSWRFLAVEQSFEIPIGFGRKFRGRWDGLIEVGGSLFVLERKTVSGEVSDRQLHHLLWDMQAGLYIMAARAKGYDVRGILYDYIPKPSLDLRLATPAEERKYTKMGALYANQRDKDEAPDEFLARIREWYDTHRQSFITHIVTRNTAQVARLVEQIKEVAADIRVCERKGSWYMNPAACSVLACPYQSVCLEDTPEAREGNFMPKEPQ